MLVLPIEIYYLTATFDTHPHITAPRYCQCSEQICIRRSTILLGEGEEIGNYRSSVRFGRGI